jgi:hypothetical protein
MESMETASSTVARFTPIFSPFDVLLGVLGAVVVSVPDDVDGDELIDGDADDEGNDVCGSPVLEAVGVLDVVELTAVLSDAAFERTGTVVGSGNPQLSRA